MAEPSALESVEARLAKATEKLVASGPFSEVLAFTAGNLAVIVRKGGGVADSAVRGLRIAGRRDVVAFGRQLARTEDKLERVLQEVEALQDELRAQNRKQSRKKS